MDVVSNAADTLARQSTTAISAAAEELAKQATVIGQLATSKDPIAWLAGEDADDDGAGHGDNEDQPPPPPLTAVPLAALRTWGAGHSDAWGSFGRGPTATNATRSGGYGSGDPAAELAARLGFDFDDDEEPGGYASCSSYNRGEAVTAASANCDGQPHASGGDEVGDRSRPPFCVDLDINGKVFLWQGNICALDVDCVVAPAAAGFAPGSSTVFPDLLRYGGQDFRADLKHLDSCRSGEARLTKAYGLPCRWFAVTVGPKYKEKYQIAAQNTLNACYRESFQLLAEAELASIAIPCAWYQGGYPAEEQANVALRTVRKCLENLRHVVEAVVITARNAEELALYEDLMPLYFPRTEQEANAGCGTLPDSCWSKWGEVSVEERKIRVSALISSCDDADEDRGDDWAPIFTAGSDADRGFLDARVDADEVLMKRLDSTMVDAETVEMAKQACIRYLRRSNEVLREPKDRRFIYPAGLDRLARHVVVLLGARLPALGVRDERTLPLFVKELEMLEGKSFVLLYVNSCVSALDSTNLEVLQEMIAVISARYRGSFEQLLVLHPGIWFRAAFAVGRAVNETAALVWDHTVYVEAVAELASYVCSYDDGSGMGVESTLHLPEYVRASESS